MPLAPELRRRSGRISSPPSRQAMPSPGRRSSSRSKLLWRTGGGARHGETEGTAVPLPCRFDPNTPSMHLDNPLDQGQADVCAVAGAIQALEETKDLLAIVWRNPYAIIAHITGGLLGIPPHAAVDARLGPGTHEFHGNESFHDCRKHLEPNGKSEDSANSHGYILLVLALRARGNHAAVARFP